MERLHPEIAARVDDEAVHRRPDLRSGARTVGVHHNHLILSGNCQSLLSPSNAVERRLGVDRTQCSAGIALQHALVAGDDESAATIVLEVPDQTRFQFIWNRHLGKDRAIEHP